jgi:malonyl-CoA/methylmalonyl-CoA synthetase
LTIVSSNVYQFFARHFPADAERTFIEKPSGASVTLRELDRHSARYARCLLDLGIAKGERVVAQVEKSVENIYLYLGCLRAGLVYVPLNTAYQKAEIEYFIGDAQPALVVCRPQGLDVVAPIARAAGVKHVYGLSETGSGSLIDALPSAELALSAPVDVACADNDLASILYTSGTTGRSKGAMLTHRNLASNAQTLVEHWGMSERDVLIHALPTFHIHGLFVALHTALVAGARLVFLNKFDAAQVIEALPGATMFMGVPTYYTRLLQEPALDTERCRNMRLFISGSAPLLTETFNEFRTRTDHTILERYGMSETGMNTSNPLEGERKAGTVGRALPGVDVRVVDERDQGVAADVIGAIQVRGPNVFAGYWRRPELNDAEFTRDGYFRTGDMGRFDADGYLSIVGRSKDIVISGGLNIYPKEIESYLDEIEGVQESAVIGVPHVDFGEALVAVIDGELDSERLTEEYLIKYMKERVAGFKVPKRVVFVHELPRNTMGKVQKNVLRERYRDLFK